MVKLDELIQKLCPHGVKFQDLENCCLILDDQRKRVTHNDRVTGAYPCYGANGIQGYLSNYLFDGRFVLVGADGSVLTSDGTPIVNWVEGKIWVTKHDHIIVEKDGVLLRYLFYYLQTVNIKQLVYGKVPILSVKDFHKIKVAVPPLEVQQEIVSILDELNQGTEELISTLEAELKLCQRQYAYYSHLLFQATMPEEAWTRVAETIFSLKTGLNPRQHFKLNEGGTVPISRSKT